VRIENELNDYGADAKLKIEKAKIDNLSTVN
jgi:hypothetical protein